MLGGTHSMPGIRHGRHKANGCKGCRVSDSVSGVKREMGSMACGGVREGLRVVWQGRSRRVLGGVFGVARKARDVKPGERGVWLSRVEAKEHRGDGKVVYRCAEPIRGSRAHQRLRKGLRDGGAGEAAEHAPGSGQSARSGPGFCGAKTRTTGSAGQDPGGEK